MQVRFELSIQKGWKILEVSYHKPTLNDVFLYLTGREIREENGESFAILKTVVRRRFR